ncbi:AraC family transcriptional regulator [Intestinibacillus sp. Marseille-P6563]|uniref:AraC family transcriptional regulator n=1 Tax=Intestinibacillus sp. Marseille-P6563 TaxID=2364792 RepID=UPI000F04FDFE|nr:AraC family transcriptional regulator [Intestinibacillus sp. Marseille-P6563]
MKNYEIGVLPASTWFFFSPTEDTKKLFYYHTMCGHFFCTKDYYIKRKTFPVLLLVYVQHGEFYLELEDGHYTAQAGQIAFFDCRQPHYYHGSDDLEFYYLHFDGPQASELCRYINQNSGVVIDGENNDTILKILDEMILFYQNGGNESIFTTSARIYRLLMLLNSPIISPRLKKNDDSLIRAVSYIRSNVGKRISLQELADVAGLSVYYFSHLFKEMTGQSPTEFVINSRIDQAKALLLTSDLSVAEVSRQVGYPNSSNLISLFAKRVGCSPAQFRKENRASFSDQARLGQPAAFIRAGDRL